MDENFNCKNHIQDIKGQRENYISFEKPETASKDGNDNGIENDISCSNCKPNVEDSEVCVRCLSPLQESTKMGDAIQQQLSNKVKSEHDEDATMGLKYCPNSKTISTLQASFGKLFRIGTMRSIMWTREIPNEACCLVLPHSNSAQKIGTTFDDQESMSIMLNCGKNDISQQGCNDSLMVVDTFVSEQDRRRIASTFGYDLPVDSRNPKELTDYMECVAEFGFNHIIIIGEIDYGMVFMDCYGRLFQWEDMRQMLWPSESDDDLPWFVGDDGNVYEYKS